MHVSTVCVIPIKLLCTHTMCKTDVYNCEWHLRLLKITKSVMWQLRGMKGIIISFVNFVNPETLSMHRLQNYEGIGARFVKAEL